MSPRETFFGRSTSGIGDGGAVRLENGGAVRFGDGRSRLLEKLDDIHRGYDRMVDSFASERDPGSARGQ